MQQNLVKAEGREVAKWCLVAAVVWMAVTMTIGFVASLQMLFPSLNDISWFSFVRLRVIHVNGVLFAFLTMAYLGAIYYLVPKLTGGKIPEGVAKTSFWLLNGIVVLAVLSFLSGRTEGREYAELPRPLDLLVVVFWVMMTYAAFKAVLTGTEKRWYVTLWFFLQSIIWLGFCYLVGMVPLGGIADAVALWAYGHGVLNGWFQTMALGILYWVIPVTTGRPIFSHLLSLIHFWALVVLMFPGSNHHLIQAPIPEWLKFVTIAFSVGMLLPASVFFTNMFQTLKGNWHQLRRYDTDGLALKFAVAGVTFYLLNCIFAAIQSIRPVNAFIHATQWVVGHAHMAVIGVSALPTIALIYAAMRRLTGQEVPSLRLGNWHFWLTIVGYIGVLATLKIAGIVQGIHRAASIPFEQTMDTMRIFYMTRSFFGLLLVIGAWICAYLVVKWFLSKPVLERAVELESLERQAIAVH